MQSEECGNRTGIEPGEAHRYTLFGLAGVLPAPRWRNGLSLAFPAGDVAAMEGGAVMPGCIGLLGMAGTLPYAYTEAVARAGGSAAREFMDLLSAPAVNAFCSAWRAARPEHASLPALPARGGPLRARALGELLARELGVPVRVEQFAGRWQALPPDQCSTAGRAHARCGQDALLGARLWRLDGAVRVVVGPLARAQAQAFVPGGSGARALAEHWRALAGGAAGHGGAGVAAEAHVRVRAGDACGSVLGAGARLGYDALMLTGPVARQRDDLRYSLC